MHPVQIILLYLSLCPSVSSVDCSIPGLTLKYVGEFTKSCTKVMWVALFYDVVCYVAWEA